MWKIKSYCIFEYSFCQYKIVYFKIHFSSLLKVVSEFQDTNSMIMFYISSPLNNLFSSTNYLFYHHGESSNKIVFYLHT